MKLHPIGSVLIATLLVTFAPLRGRAESLAGEAKTPVYIAVDGALAGLVAVADPMNTMSAGRCAAG